MSREVIRGGVLANVAAGAPSCGAAQGAALRQRSDGRGMGAGGSADPARQGRIADCLSRKDFIIRRELDNLAFTQSGRQLLFHPICRLNKHPPLATRE